MKQITILIMILCCATNVSAWSSEGGLEANESFVVTMASEWHQYDSISNPYHYMGYQAGSNIGDPTTLHLEGRFNENTDSQVELSLDYTMCKMFYNGTGYEQSDCCETLTIPVKSTIICYGSPEICYHSIDHTEDIDLTLRYFQAMVNDIDCHNFATGNELGKPDILKMTVEIEADGSSLDDSYTMYASIDQDQIDNIGNEGHGFDLDSICGGGGSETLSTQIGFGEMSGESSAMKGMFEIIFYSMIPVLFLLVSIRFISKLVS